MFVLDDKTNEPMDYETLLKEFFKLLDIIKELNRQKSELSQQVEELTREAALDWSLMDVRRSINVKRVRGVIH